MLEQNPLPDTVVQCLDRESVVWREAQISAGRDFAERLRPLGGVNAGAGWHEDEFQRFFENDPSYSRYLAARVRQPFEIGDVLTISGDARERYKRDFPMPTPLQMKIAVALLEAESTPV